MNRPRGKFGIYAAVLILCCATTAMGQSISEDVSAQVGAAPSSSVSSATVGSQVSAGYSGMAMGATAGRSASGASWASSGRGLNGSNGSIGFEGAHAPTLRTRRSETVSRGRTRYRMQSMSLRFTPRRFHRIASRYGFQGAARGAVCSEMGISAGGHSPACGLQTVKVRGRASYSAGFADSTRGTALISPPDTGTSSPLEWTPAEVGGGGLQFMPNTFLNPGLSPVVGVGIPMGRRGRRNKKVKSPPEQPGLSPLQNPLLQGNTLGQPSLEPDLGSSGSQGTNLGGLPSPLDTNNGLSSGLNQQ